MSALRARSVLAVAEETLWDELEALAPVSAHVERVLDPLRRVMAPSFDRDVLPALGDRVLVRYARQPAERQAEERAERTAQVAGLRAETRRLLHRAQRHALDGVVLGAVSWDPKHDAPNVRTLVGAGLLEALEDGAEPYAGAYRVSPDAPEPPSIAYDFSEAVMEETDDLAPAGPGPIGLLHDLASLAAALEHVDPRVTHAGTLAIGDARKLGRRLASPGLVEGGRLEEDERWGRALRGLRALHMVSTDALERTLHLDVGLESTLRGETEEACDRLVRRLLDRDLHAVVPAVREALRQAGDGAVDTMIFREALHDQHRDVLLAPWERHGERVYPGREDLPYDADNFDRVEGRMIDAALRRMARFGLVRLADGVFAGTEDGRRWAGALDQPRPPVWVSGDLELIVPPDAVSAFERFQLERLGRCLQRDVVDRYQLEERALTTWLATHDVEEALDLLRRRCPGVPRSVEEGLRAWAASAERIVLTRGVLLG